MTETLLEKNIAPIVRRSVLAVIGELLGDPDFGLSLKRGFETKLKRSIRERKADRVYTLTEVKNLLKLR